MPLPPECAGRGDHDVADRPAVGCEEPGIAVPERNPEAGDGEVAAVVDALQFRDRRPLGVEQVDVALLEVFAPPAGVVEVDHLQFGDRVDGDEAFVVRLAEGYFPVDDPEADLAALLPPDLVLRAVAGDPGDDANRNPGLLHGLALCIEGDLRGAVRPGQVNFDGAVFQPFDPVMRRGHALGRTPGSFVPTAHADGSQRQFAAVQYQWYRVAVIGQEHPVGGGCRRADLRRADGVVDHDRNPEPGCRRLDDRLPFVAVPDVAGFEAVDRERRGGDRAQFEFHHGLQVPHRDVGHLLQRYLGGVVPPQLVGVDKSLRRTVLDGCALLPEDDPDGLALVVGEYDRLSGGDPFAAVVFIRGLHAFAAAAERHRHRVPRTGRCRAHCRVVVSGLGA